MIEIKDLRKSIYGKSIINGLNLSVYEGERIALLGRNGAGKSTLINLICGIRKPDSGYIRINDFPADSELAKSIIGLSPQDIGFPGNLTIEEILRFVASHYKSPLDYNYLIDSFGLEKYKSTQVGGMSLGNRRKISLCTALVGDPDLIILDEPTAGVDVEGKVKIWEVIDYMVSLGRTLIYSTHDMIEAKEYSDRVEFITEGSIKNLNTIKKEIEELAIIVVEGDLKVPENLFLSSIKSSKGKKYLTNIPEEIISYTRSVNLPKSKIRMQPISLEDIILFRLI